jgi:hypothetical protein
MRGVSAPFAWSSAETAVLSDVLLLVELFPYFARRKTRATIPTTTLPQSRMLFVDWFIYMRDYE